MSEDKNRLNIERAREALARARAEQLTAAVRSPRPADLSRLQESEARRNTIDAHADDFRNELRARLNLGEYRGPKAPTSRYLANVMSAPVCDADVCMPVRPASDMPEPLASPEPTSDMAGIAAESLQSEPMLVSVAAQDNDGETSEQVEAVDPAETVNEDTPAKAKKRRKFLGLF